MKNKVLVLGRGYLGREFERHGYTVWGSDSPFCTKQDNKYHYDWASLDKFSVIINCIGKSNTRWCETHFEEAYQTNALFVKTLSEYCHEHDIKLVHISTGCLYDRSHVPNRETDFIVAHCNYTVTKWAGEQYCLPEDLIVRPRLFFGGHVGENNLLCKLHRFEKFCTTLDSLASTLVVVEAVETLLLNEQCGIFNVGCDGFISIYDIGKLVGISRPEMTSEELRTREKLYLVNNVMDISKLKKFYSPPHIDGEIRRCWAELTK